MRVQYRDNNLEGWRPSRAEVFEFLNGQPLGVLASVDKSGQPQVATVAFSQTPELSLIIGTDEQSRKAVNIVNDPRVAFVVTDAEERYTVQLEGAAKILSKEEFAAYEQAHYDKLPASAPFKDIKGQCFIIIEPHYLRFSDCNPHPWVLTEFTFEK